MTSTVNGISINMIGSVIVGVVYGFGMLNGDNLRAFAKGSTELSVARAYTAIG